MEVVGHGDGAETSQSGKDLEIGLATAASDEGSGKSRTGERLWLNMKGSMERPLGVQQVED